MRYSAYVIGVLWLVSSAATGKVLIGVIGDSISQAFNVKPQANFRNSEIDSWATGTGAPWSPVFSQTSRYVTYRSSDVQAFNASATLAFANNANDNRNAIANYRNVLNGGRGIPNLWQQYAQMVCGAFNNYQGPGCNYPHYLMIEIDSNDLCNVDPNVAKNNPQLVASRVYGAVWQVVSDLLYHQPAAQILVVPTPDVARLKEVFARANLGYGVCQQKWNALPMLCPNLLPVRAPVTPAQFRRLQTVVNHSLLGLQATYPHNVTLVRSIERYRFRAAEVSGLDCFHPSLAGQNSISHQAWATGWMYR